MTKRRDKRRSPIPTAEAPFRRPKRKLITPMRLVFSLLLSGVIAVAFIGLTTTSNVFGARLTDIRGNSFSIADYRGKVVLLDFMASWCPACKAETPHLISLYQQYINSQQYGSSIVMISISMWDQETDQTLSGFVNSFPGMRWTIARDTANIWTSLRLTSLPTLIVLDKQGNINFERGASSGPISETTLSSIIAQFL